MKKLVMLVMLIGLFQLTKAQNQLNMGQYMIHQPFMNPASVGSYTKTTFAGFYRAQWTKFNGAPVTQGINAIIPVKSLKHVLSFSAFHDVLGINNNSEVSVGYSYVTRFARNRFISFGVSASVDLLKSDYNELHTITPDDPLFVTNTGITPLPDFKFGIYYFQSKFYAGFSIPNLLNNEIQFTTDGASVGSTQFNPEDLHYYFHTGYQFTLNEKSDLNVSTLVKNASGAPMQIDANLQYMYNKQFGIGVSYRTSKEVLGILTYQINSDFKLSYAYEYNMGLIGDYSNGSHEIMMVYQIKPPKETVVSIPRF